MKKEVIRVVKYVKKHEGEDVYDNNISYNVFKIFSPTLLASQANNIFN